ncbi:MAG: stage II sporulation protein R [Eubacteriales bacterium]|nr:stage II sporulation protein R [Eubacteriales bacterium]
MKRIITALLIGLSTLGITMEYSHLLSNELQNSVYRLHVIANSDESYDQELKLKVRDRVIRAMDNLTDGDDTLEEAKNLSSDNLTYLCSEAIKEVRNNGYEYPVTIKTGRFPFPTKQYGNISLPKGKYEGLKISIGSGKGQNWWCVLYPNLCFVDGVVKMPKDSTEKLKGSMSKEAYSVVKNNATPKYKLKFKVLELFD